MIPSKKPNFCLTSDTDWASDYAINDFIELVSSYGIKPTIFATHKSTALIDCLKRGAVEVGIHPNFLPASTQGSDVQSIIRNVTDAFPNAKSFRCHKFFNNTEIEQEMVKNKFAYDSNLCLYFQQDIVPIRRVSGLIGFPVFWEDDVHWMNNGKWELGAYSDLFLSQGLKILNFHPFFVCANIPDKEYYERVKPHIATVSESTIHQIYYKGKGVKTFLIELLDFLKSRAELFCTLDELYKNYFR